MKRLILILAALSARAQTNINTLGIIPNPTRTTPGSIRLWNSTQTFYTGIVSSSPTANVNFHFPAADGSSGQCLKTDGSTNLTFGSCASVSVPLTLSGTSSSPALTVANAGTGSGIDVSANGGGLSAHFGTGNVTIDNNLTVSGVSSAVTAFRLNGNTVINSGGYAVVGGGAVFMDSSGNFTLAGAASGTHMQNLGSGDSPTFASISTTGNASFGSSDNAYLSVDAAGNKRLGFTKKSGSNPALTYGSAINFVIAESNAADIGSGNTFTPRLTIDTGGSATFSGMVAASQVNASGSMSAASMLLSSSSIGNMLYAWNHDTSGGGTGIYAQTDSTNSASYAALGFANGSGSNGLLGQASTGIGVEAFTTGSGAALYAHSSGGGYAGHFGAGAVLVDNNLTAGSLTSTGTFNMSGNVTAHTHMQPIGSGDDPTFRNTTVNNLTISGTCTGCPAGGTAGYGISISGGVVSLTGAASGNTAVLNYSPGIKVTSFSGSSGVVATYTNSIYVYDSSGTYMGAIPLI